MFYPQNKVLGVYIDKLLTWHYPSFSYNIVTYTIIQNLLHDSGFKLNHAKQLSRHFRKIHICFRMDLIDRLDNYHELPIDVIRRQLFPCNFSPYYAYANDFHLAISYAISQYENPKNWSGQEFGKGNYLPF